MSLSKPNQYAIASRDSQLPAPSGADATYFLPKVEPGRLWGIILRRGWIVILASLLGGGGLYYFAKGLPKTYVSFGSVFVNSQAPDILDIRAVAPEETQDLEQMRSVEQGMSASTLLMRVIEANELDKDASFAPAGMGKQALLAKFSSRVTVALRRGTRLIDIQVEDTDPERARRLVSSLVSEYEKWTDDRQKSIIQQASNGLAREEVRLRERMEESALELQEYRKAHPIPGLEGQESSGPMRDTLSALNSQLSVAKAARLRLQSEFEAYVKFDSANPAALSGLESSERGTEVLSQIRTLQAKETEFSRVKERYQFKHPVYKDIANEIGNLRQNLADTVRAAGQSLEQRLRVALENEAKLESEIALARKDAVDVEGVRETFRSMMRSADADRTLHDSVALRLRETTLAATVPTSVLSWRDMPLTPESPHGPKKMVFAAVGLFFGFLGGAVLLVGLELGDRKIRDSAAASRATSSPLLAELPVMDGSGDGMVLMSDPASPGAEAFRRLRFVLAPPAGSNTARTVLFSSAKPGEGKSFCALNYATALAMQGHRTLLLDADLRGVGLSRQYLDGSAPDSGLGGYLGGKVDPAEACFTTALPNLYLLSSGPMRSDAAELLAGTRFPSLLEDAYRWFDRVVIDSPPVLTVSDMLAIARYADRSCLVVRHNGSDSRDLKKAADLIRSAGGNLVGFVWNDFSKNGSSSSSIGPGVPVNRRGLGGPQPVGVTSAIPDDSFAIVPNFT